MSKILVAVKASLSEACEPLKARDLFKNQSNVFTFLKDGKKACVGGVVILSCRRPHMAPDAQRCTMERFLRPLWASSRVCCLRLGASGQQQGQTAGAGEARSQRGWQLPPPVGGRQGSSLCRALLQVLSHSGDDWRRARCSCDPARMPAASSAPSGGVGSGAFDKKRTGTGRYRAGNR